MKASAIAHPNIALVKYWGKRDARLNLPATDSLSLTLAPLHTHTTVTWRRGGDAFVLNGVEQRPRDVEKVARFLDLVRMLNPELSGAEIVSHNNFPTAAGLASSASAFAALALAATSAAGVTLSPRELSVLARRGSGSAARSIFGGFVRMNAGGEDEEGNDAYAEAIAESNHWDLRVLFALTTTGAKAIPSTRGMNETMRTSPYFSAWCEQVPRAMHDAEKAIAARDFELLAETAEASALQMHASAIAARPGVVYWNGATVELIHAVRTLRTQGLAAFFTIDAGPHVKVFTTAGDAAKVEEALRAQPGVIDVLAAAPGPGAHLTEEHLSPSSQVL